MANYLDKTPTFNPYIAQQPVEAMVTVGMQKQKQYDEGLQRIQSTIDTVAGIDIARDVDKQYLQTKMSNLGTKLQTVAAGDFSNFQLTNSVAGMTRSIVKDKNIRNAIKSTQQIRKGQADQEIAKKAGKTSPENDFYWSEQVNNYLKDQNLDTSFSGGYVEYTDVTKQLRELTNELHEVDSSFDMPYMNRDGQMLYFDSEGKETTSDKGNPRVDMAMLETKTKGKSAERIYKSFLATLDEKQKNQLMITGRYHYRGATPATFLPIIDKKYNDRKNMLTEYRAQLVDLNARNDISDTERTKVKTQLEDVDEELNLTLDQNKEKQIQALKESKDLSAYAGSFYIDQYLSELAQSLSYESKERAIKTNPYWQEEQKLIKIQTELMAKQKEEELNLPYMSDIPKGTEMDDPSLNSVFKTIQEKDLEIQALNGKFITHVQDQKIFDTENPPKDPEIRKKAIQSYLDDVMKRSRKNPETITGDEADYVLSREKIEKEKMTLVNTRDLVQKKSDERRIQYEEEYFKDKDKNKEVTVKIGEESFTLPMIDMYHLSQDIKYITDTKIKIKKKAQSNIEKGVFANNPGKVIAELATYDIFARNKFDEIRSKYKGTDLERLIDIVASNKTGLFEKNPDMKNGIFHPIKQVINDMEDFSSSNSKLESEELRKRLPEFFSVRGAISNENDVDVEKAKAVLHTAIMNADQLGISQEKEGDFDSTIAGEMLANKDATFSYVKNPDGTGILEVTLDGKIQKVPMTRSEFSTAFPKYAATNPVSPYITQIAVSEQKTTNKTHGTSYTQAYITDMTGTNLEGTTYTKNTRMDVVGVFNNDGSSSDRYRIVLYHQLDDGRWVHDYINEDPKDTLDASQLSRAIMGVGTITVDEVVKRILNRESKRSKT